MTPTCLCMHATCISDGLFFIIGTIIILCYKWWFSELWSFVEVDFRGMTCGDRANLLRLLIWIQCSIKTHNAFRSLHCQDCFRVLVWVEIHWGCVRWDRIISVVQFNSESNITIIYWSCENVDMSYELSIVHNTLNTWTWCKASRWSKSPTLCATFLELTGHAGCTKAAPGRISATATYNNKCTEGQSIRSVQGRYSRAVLQVE